MSDLTIAVLTYNRSDYLSQMLKSISNQTYGDFKVLILDNASTDNTNEIVQPFLEDKRFNYICNSSNIGGVGNYNKALELCDTKYLMITHDDDVMEPDLIKEELSCFDKYLDLIMVSANANTINDKGNFISISSIKENAVYEQYEFIAAYINDFYGCNICCPTIMIDVTKINKGSFCFRDDVGKSLDTYAWFELNTKKGKILKLGKPLYNYRVHSSQDSANWLYMLPLLRMPVYHMLNKCKQYSLAHKWMDFITPYSENALLSGAYKKEDYYLIRNNILKKGAKDCRLKAKLILKCLKKNLKCLKNKLRNGRMNG